MIQNSPSSQGCEIRTLISKDGTELSYRRWFRKQSTAVCIFLAGIESHGGWYEVSSSELFKRGFSVYFLDRRGSGLSKGGRGDVRRIEDLYGDIEELIHHIRSEEKKRTIFLIGISWGAKLSLGFCLKYSNSVDALILITPGLATLVDYSLKEKLAIFLSSIFVPSNLFKIPIPNPGYFTRDPNYINFIMNDELRVGEITARFCLQTFRLDSLNRKGYRSLRLPICLFLAGKDRITDNDGVRHIFEGFASKEKRLYYYANAVHTLEFDVVRERHITDLCEWMEHLLEQKTISNKLLCT